MIKSHKFYSVNLSLCVLPSLSQKQVNDKQVTGKRVARIFVISRWKQKKSYKIKNSNKNIWRKGKSKKTRKKDWKTSIKETGCPYISFGHYYYSCHFIIISQFKSWWCLYRFRLYLNIHRHIHTYIYIHTWTPNPFNIQMNKRANGCVCILYHGKRLSSLCSLLCFAALDVT